MLNISIDMTTGQAALQRATAIKAGGAVPVSLVFSADPGDDPLIELALCPQSAPAAVVAYLDEWEEQNSTTFTGVLDGNDTRLIWLLAGKTQQTLDAEIVVTAGGMRRPFANLSVTVQAPVITGPESSEGGPVYLTETQCDGRYVGQAEKGSADGVATLDGSGKVPAGQLPSYVDDIVEAADFEALPETGETGKIYVTLDDGATYRWGGSAYAPVSNVDQAARDAAADAAAAAAAASAAALSTPRTPTIVTNGAGAIVLLGDVTAISNSQFFELDGKGVCVGSRCASIGNTAFRDWSSCLIPPVLAYGVASIGMEAFHDWNSCLQPPVLPASITSLGLRAFSAWNSCLNPPVIPSSITSIPNYCFGGWMACSTPPVIPSSVIAIGDYAFSNWTSCTSAPTFANGIATFGIGAFSGWISATVAPSLPASVTRIGAGAFAGWTACASAFRCYATAAPSLGANPFQGSAFTGIRVPVGATGYGSTYGGLTVIYDL